MGFRGKFLGLAAGTLLLAAPANAGQNHCNANLGMDGIYNCNPNGDIEAVFCSSPDTNCDNPPVVNSCGLTFNAYCSNIPAIVATTTTPDCNSYFSDTDTVLACNGGSVSWPISCPGNTTNCKSASAPCSGGLPVQFFTAYCPTLPSATAITVPQTSTDTSTGTSAATRAALEAQQAELQRLADEANRHMAELLSAKANATGVGQEAALKSADDVNALGASSAANIGVLYCAQGSVDHAGHADDLAGANLASCQQYFSAADALRPKGAQAYQPDSSVMGTAAAAGILGSFEKQFGVSGADLTSRLLGAGDRFGELSDATNGKVDGASLAQNSASESGTKKDTLELSFAGAPKGKINPALRDSLRKALVAKTNESTRTPASSTAPGKEVRMRGLEPLREGLFSEQPAATEELTIFGVVHRKLVELTKRYEL